MEIKNSEFENVNCAICNSNDFDKLAEIGMFELPAHFGLCKKCGFGYLNPRWTAARYLKFYTEEYDQHYRPEVGRTNSDGYKYNGIKEILKRFEQHKTPLSNIKNVLDVGSGEGWFLDYLNKNTFPEANYFAIEPSDDCVKVMNSLGINHLIHDVDIDWHIGNENKFDLIIMRHVLEHFLYPLEVLKKVQSVLSENGILYIGVPCMDNPSQPVSKDFIRNVHVNYFSKISLTKTLEMTGFIPLDVVNFPPTNLYEIYAISRKNNGLLPFIKSENEYPKMKEMLSKFLSFEKSPIYPAYYFIAKRLRKYKRKLGI